MDSVERCFICGIRMGRGNQPTIGKQEKRAKLITVSQTVEHSSTIISDILSRILNETVMQEEAICRICFNLLNDIDYHLKEAQEKTDEITDKFLDKGKDPFNYQPQPIVTAEEPGPILPPSKKRHSKKRSAASSNLQDEASSAEEERDNNEMPMNIINKNKQKLLSYVLNPKMKVRQEKQQTPSRKPNNEYHHMDVEDEEEEEEDEPKHKRVKRKNRERERGSRKSNTKKAKERSSEYRKPPTIEVSAEEEDLVVNDAKDLGKIVTSEEEEKGITEKSSPSKESQKTVYFARKSEPSKSSVSTSPEATPDKAIAESFNCKECNKSFKKATNLQLHVERVHTPAAAALMEPKFIPEMHKCPMCPKAYTNAISLAAHQKEHEQSDLKSPSSVKTKPSPAKPKTPQAAKDGEVKATCPECNKTFRRMFNMRTHIDRVHKKIKPFACNSCDKTFATNSDLKQHKTVHGEGKVFTCELCDRTFTNRDSIILHRKQHTNERTHFCELCDKGFFKASCLNRHMRTHTRERPYTCDACHKGFSQSSSMKAHKAKCPAKQDSGGVLENTEEDYEDWPS